MRDQPTITRSLSQAAATTAAVILAIVFQPASAGAQTGTIGNPCYFDRTCAEGACNARGRCEPCGDHGQIACRRGIICYEEYRGFRPIQALNGGDLYCGLLTEDDAYAPGYCGYAGFPPCEGSTPCQGASVYSRAHDLCLACGLLEQVCCFGSPSRLCDEGACNRSSRRCERGRATPPDPGSRRQPDPEFDPGRRDGGGFEEDFAPPPRTQYTGCVCYSTDGRNGGCRENGCVEPSSFSGTCFWSCSDANGDDIYVRGRDGATCRPGSYCPWMPH